MREQAKQPHRIRRAFASLLAGAVLLASFPLAAFADDGAAAAGGWKFSGFGTSTSAAANTLKEGADIATAVSLTSCTVKEDGTIDKKGGKFVADSPADGISFYYTTIDPTKENFVLQADVTIDYINPAPDGQEGFALMVRDTISGSGSYFSNQISVTGTKLPLDGVEIKDAVGVRYYTGIISNETAASNDVKAVREAFSAQPIQKGDVYRVRLEKTNNGYVATQYAINADGTTGAVVGSTTLYIPAKDTSATKVSKYSELDDPMTVQEASTAYVGFAAARGMNVTFSNITYTTSAWDAAQWTTQPTSYVEPSYQITSPSTCAESSYELVFKANADGVATVYANGKAVDKNVAVKAGEELVRSYAVSKDTTFKVQFTPDKSYAISAYEKLSDYSTKTVEKKVTVRKLGQGGTIYVSPTGTSAHNGKSAADAVDLQTALSYASAGQTVLLESGVYALTGELKIERGRNGTEAQPITVTTADGKYATLDFGGVGTGFTAWGDWWNISKLNITATADGSKGMQLAGSHCILEQMNFYNNGNTGLQISGVSTDTIERWPSYNTVRNCTSMNNADRAMEDADGFAAKLTTGVGNVFDGCIAAYNADDGWDLFAKAATGSIGAVTIQNSVAYKNGYLMLQKEAAKKEAFTFPTVSCDDNGNLSFSNVGVTIEAGNGNGFKMGGTNLPGDHKLVNSISYDNAAKGIDSNSCPDVKVYNSTSYNNEGYNVALYTNNKSAATGYAAEGVISFRKGTDGKEQLGLQSQSSTAVYGESNFYWDSETQTSHNNSSNAITVSESWFQSLDTSVEPSRNADGSIDMHGLLLLTAEGLAATAAGARGAAWGQAEPARATIWVVGDSTVSPFSDSYYLPREGYGEELDYYFNANVYNLAVSGASSKDFTGMANYKTLMNGSDAVPALGDAEGDKFLIIGFGHNDEKTEDARYTDPNGDYLTAGSFANSLYVNYIQPALERGVTPVVCTPIARLTAENTLASYEGASSHKTSDVTIDGRTFAGGDYAQAIRDMCSQLGLICVDLTAATVQENVAMGKNAQWTHAFTGAKEGKNGAMTATGLDLTHTNSYGAKLNAWLISELTASTPLGAYSKGKAKPSYELYFGDAVNPDYVPSSYTSPTETSKLWASFTDANGMVWNGTAFGNVGGDDKITGGDFSAVVTDSTVTLGVKNNRGKIASTVDGIMMYYIQIPAGTTFTLTAKATVNHLEKNNQVSFGLMARDDLYIDTSISDPIGDYVAVGTRNQGKINCFGRKSGELYDGPSASKKYDVGDTVELKLVGTADGYTLTYGENATVSAGFDYALTAVDSDYVYVGFYVARNANVTFSDICLEAELPQTSLLEECWKKVQQFPAWLGELAQSVFQ
ncbi:MAG: hypothetical protein ACI4LE_08320 [Faecalibacterium sp.]